MININFVVSSRSLGEFYDRHYVRDLWDCLASQDTSHLCWLYWSYVYRLPYSVLYISIEKLFLSTLSYSRELHPFPPEVSHLSHRAAIRIKQLAFLVSSLTLKKKKVSIYTTHFEQTNEADLSYDSNVSEINFHWGGVSPVPNVWAVHP